MLLIVAEAALIDKRLSNAWMDGRFRRGENVEKFSLFHEKLANQRVVYCGEIGGLLNEL